MAADLEWKAAVHRGEVAEWFKAAVLKTAVPKGTGSSNLSSSATGGSNRAPADGTARRRDMRRLSRRKSLLLRH